jgi:tetratricopeptide (TPR) repeat protein
MTVPPHFDQKNQSVDAQTNIDHADQVIIQSSNSTLALSVPHQIPPPPPDFTGREDEIKSLLGQFDQGATIAGLRGMGGEGKTALALVLAKELRGRYPDGQLFLNMLGMSKSPLKPEDAMVHVIRSYRGADAPLPLDLNGLSGLHHSVLSGKKTLLLLDNAANREQVEPLLPPPGSALLVTSRIKFALPGLLEEMDLDPGVLPLEDAKKLLLKICKPIGDHAEELAKLCGCLPIALRNAAYALKEKPNFSPEGYIERLGIAKKRLELVDASFSTSYELLSPELQKLWSLLSVFPADFGLDGAAAVWETEKIPAEDALGELVKWSLVDFLPSATGEGRYKLHDLARDFADSRLEAKRREISQQRHAKYYKKILSRVDELYVRGGMDTETGLELFNLEWTNIKAGQSWSEDMIISKSLRVESILQLACNYPAEGAYAMEVLLNPRERIHWLETALVAARQLKDNKMEGSHLGNLGIAYCQIGEVEKAINIFQQRLSISRKMGDIFGESNSIGNIGAAYAIIGDTSKAIEFFERHLSIARKNGDRRGESNDLGNLGLAYLDLGKSLKAIESFKKSRKII